MILFLVCAAIANREALVLIDYVFSTELWLIASFNECNTQQMNDCNKSKPDSGGN
jgi:hypothetical protein